MSAVKQPVSGWHRVGESTRPVLELALRSLDREAWDRRWLRVQVLVAGGIEDPEHPAPFLDPEDLPWFLEWCGRWRGRDRLRSIALGEAA